MIDIPNIKDLQSKGFLKVENFLSPEEIDFFIYEYQKTLAEVKAKEDAKEFTHQIIDSGMHVILREKVEQVNKIIRENTDIQVDIFPKVSKVFDPKRIVNPWHTDPQPYYLWQNSYNVIAYWIPFIKEDYKKSNLVFFPRNKMPVELENRTRTIGGQYCTVREDNTTHYIETAINYEEIWPFNIEDYSEVVEVNAGDLILFRDDTIHRTQDEDSNRVAMAFRCLTTSSVLTKQHLLKAGSPFREAKRNNPNDTMDRVYQNLMRMYDEQNTDHVTIKDYMDYVNRKT